MTPRTRRPSDGAPSANELRQTGWTAAAARHGHGRGRDRLADAHVERGGDRRGQRERERDCGEATEQQESYDCGAGPGPGPRAEPVPYRSRDRRLRSPPRSSPRSLRPGTGSPRNGTASSGRSQLGQPDPRAPFRRLLEPAQDPRLRLHPRRRVRGDRHHAAARPRRLPTGIDLWIVHNLNPDGTALGTRLNGRGVDLNRNFGSEWIPIGRRWDPQYSGPRPWSERETRLARQLVPRVCPDVTIWYHQPQRSSAPGAAPCRGRAATRAWRAPYRRSAGRAGRRRTGRTTASRARPHSSSSFRAARSAPRRPPAMPRPSAFSFASRRPCRPHSPSRRGSGPAARPRRR